ncbi:MAG: hypothetical protein QW470_04505 [Candidatus Caldarchaeum sp.]
MIDMNGFSEQPPKMSDEELLWLVRHKVRRAILLAVGEEGRIGATALKQKLGISTGSLYYNLRQMSQLITQDERKSYRLTEDGMRIFKALTTQAGSGQNVVKTSKAAELFSSVFFPLWLFSPIYESNVVAVVLGPLSVFVLVFVLLAGRYELFLLNASPMTPVNHMIFAVKLAITYAIGLAILGVFSFLFSGRFRPFWSALKEFQSSGGVKGFLAETGKLAAAMAVAFLPLGLVPGIAVIDRVNQSSFLSNLFVRDTLLILSQTITIFLISAVVAYVKKMKWQNSMGVALTFFYLSHLVNYFKPLPG